MLVVRTTAFALAICVAGPCAAQEGGGAEVPRGLWQTLPDAVGITLHVRTRKCGRNLCARVERAKNRGGYDARSDAVGEQVFWSLKPQPDGSFLGEYSALDGTRYPQTRIQTIGKQMRIKACSDQICKDLVWNRIR